MYKISLELLKYIYNLGINFGYAKGLSKAKLNEEEIQVNIDDIVKKHFEHRD